MATQEVTLATDRGMSMSRPDLPLSGRPVLDQTELEVTAKLSSCDAAGVLRAANSNNTKIVRYYSLYKMKREYSIMDFYVKATTDPASASAADDKVVDRNKVFAFFFAGVIDGEGNFLDSPAIKTIMGRTGGQFKKASGASASVYEFVRFQPGTDAANEIHIADAKTSGMTTNQQFCLHHVRGEELYYKGYHFNPGVFGNEDWPLTIGMGLCTSHTADQTFKISCYAHTGRVGG